MINDYFEHFHYFLNKIRATLFKFLVRQFFLISRQVIKLRTTIK